MKRTGEYDAGTKPTQMARIERPRARPPTVKEIESLDTSQSLVTFGAIDVPFEVSCKIADYAVFSPDRSYSGSQLSELLRLQRICKGFRRASHYLMREKGNGDLRESYGLTREHFVLKYLHPDYPERDELVKHRWGATFVEWNKFRLSVFCDYERLPEIFVHQGTANVKVFDSRDLDVKTWVRQATGLRELHISHYEADPHNLLAQLAPQLDALHVASVAPGLVPRLLGVLTTVHGSLRDLRFPLIRARENPVKGAAATLEKLVNLEYLCLGLDFGNDTQETGWIGLLIAALEPMQKLTCLRLVVRGEHFNTTQQTSLLEALRDFARRRRTLIAMPIVLPDLEHLVDQPICQIVAENARYAPKEEEPRQD